MKSLRKIAAFVLLWLPLLFPLWAHAGVEQISEKEFRALAAELSPKVTLFQAVWREDKKAEFYGGTSRDFLYWIKGKFQNANNPAEAQKIAKELRALPFIDAREFIIGDSDVDVVSTKAIDLKPKEFGVRKFDVQSAEIFDPNSEAGFNELNQGHAPAEKIRLGRTGIVPNPGLGDGAAEIYSGKLTVHFADPKVFATTKYALEGINHPSLLALRYLRLSAINYFRTHGGGYPQKHLLLDTLDPESAAAVKKVLREANTSGELKEFLQKPKFRSWANGSIQKAFRSYTNPTAALLLMEEFGVDTLVSRYSDELDPINQYVFAKYRDEKKIADAFAKAGVKPAAVFGKVTDFFPDGFLYHGTKTEEAFRNILFQGISPSEEGSANAGLYGVNEKNKRFSENWGGDKNRLLRFPLDPDAKILDLVENPVAQALWEKWPNKQDFDAFADTYGADILRYPYDGTDAYVVKNSSVLGKAEGVYRKILSLSALGERVKVTKNFGDVVDLLLVNNVTYEEAAVVAGKKTYDRKEVRDLIGKLLAKDSKSWEGAFSAQIADELAMIFTIAFPASPPDAADKKLIDEMIKHHKPGLAETVIQFALTREAVREDPRYVADLMLQWQGTNNLVAKDLLEELGELGYWEEHPQLLLEVFTTAEKDPSNHLVNLAILRYLSGPEAPPNAWKKQTALFEHAFQSGEEKYLPYLPKAVMTVEGIEKNPEALLEILRKTSTGDDATPLPNMNGEQIDLARPPWKNHPFLKKLLGDQPVNRKNLVASWREKRKVDFVREYEKKLKTVKDPAALLEDLRSHEVPWWEGSELAAKSGVKPKDVLAYVNSLRSGAEKAEALRYFFADQAPPAAREGLQELLRTHTSDHVPKAIADILFQPAWLEHEDLIVDFCQHSTGCDRLVNQLTSIDYWKEKPELLRRLAKEAPRSHIAIIINYLGEDTHRAGFPAAWERHEGIFLDLLEAEKGDSYLMGRLALAFSNAPSLQTAENLLELNLAMSEFPRQNFPRWGNWQRFGDLLATPRWQKDPLLRKVLGKKGAHPNLSKETLAQAWQEKRGSFLAAEAPAKKKAKHNVDVKDCLVRFKELR